MSASTPLILAVGVSCVDFLAYVEAFPTIDSKIRTNDLQIGVGGNVLNGLCANSIFGVKSRLVTAVGNDSNSQLVLHLCERLSIDTDCIKIFENAKTPFSYIIIDKSTQTRTIIHTAGQDMTEEHVKPDMLNNATLLYLDGRYIHAAVHFADLAEERGIPIVLDMERNRENIPDLYLKLLKKSTALIINSTFATTYTKKADLLEALVIILELQINSRRFVISTFGARGSVLVRRYVGEDKKQCKKINFFHELKSHMDHKQVSVQEYDEKSIDYFFMEEGKNKYDIIYCSAYPFDEIVDTTGAGDMYIGCVCSSLVKGYTVTNMMKLASFVAGYKCTKPGGASNGIPTLQQIPFKF